MTQENNSLTTAMLFAAGLGTRLKPFTNNHPKALVVVNGKTLLQRNIEYLQSFGIEKIVVNVHHFAQQIIDILQINNGWGVEIIISDEITEVLETGGGLKKAVPLFGEAENILVMNVDILTNLNIATMYKNHLQLNAMATLAVTNRQTSRYLIFDKRNQLVGWQNVNTGEIKGLEKIDEAQYCKMAFSGIHIINKAIFKNIKLAGKFSMIDLYLSIMDDVSIKCYSHANDNFIDVGKPESIVKAEELFS